MYEEYAGSPEATVHRSLRISDRSRLHACRVTSGTIHPAMPSTRSSGRAWARRFWCSSCGWTWAVAKSTCRSARRPDPSRRRRCFELILRWANAKQRSDGVACFPSRNGAGSGGAVGLWFGPMCRLVQTTCRLTRPHGLVRSSVRVRLPARTPLQQSMTTSTYHCRDTRPLQESLTSAPSERIWRHDDGDTRCVAR